MSRERRLRDLIARLVGPEEPEGSEMTCERCFERLDEYVDLELAGEYADARLPGMLAHLRSCPACREDHERLRDPAAGDPDG